MRWVATAQQYEFGPYTVVYLRQRGEGATDEGGHEVRFPDGRTVHVYPDGQTSGKKRFHVISKALTTLSESHGSLEIDPVAYLLGVLHMVGIRHVEHVAQARPEDIIGMENVDALVRAGFQIVEAT